MTGPLASGQLILAVSAKAAFASGEAFLHSSRLTPPVKRFVPFSPE
jgi:hypothetical protein